MAKVQVNYLVSEEMQVCKEALEYAVKLIDGFESPFDMELLATIDWLLERENCEPTNCEPTISSLREGLNNWKNKQAAKKNALI